MTDFVGLTWDHPRGRNALEHAATLLEGPDTLRWEVQPLEGFESSPIDELAQRYDLIVLDHPHLGDALATDCLTPWDDLVTAAELSAWRDAAVGPSFTSYELDGHVWALPLDAATQVAAYRPDLLDTVPVTWDDALSSPLTAPSLAGPHAFLSLCSISVSLGDEPGADGRFSTEAFEILAGLAHRAPEGTAHLNPIGLLELMSTTDALAYVPLVYGYVTYAAHGVSVAAPPSAGRRIGSTIGGTGIAVSRRATATPALLDHVRMLMSPEAQSGLIPRLDGQPSARSAWTDPAVDAAANGFYSETLETIEQAWVRPRFAGYIPFQSRASALLRESIAAGDLPVRALDRLEELYATATAASTEGVTA